MSPAKPCLLEVVQHDSVADQMAIGRHQHPLVQQRKSASAQQHGVGVDEAFRVGEWARSHHRSIQTAEGAARRDEVSLVLVHLRQHVGDVIRPVPVVGIEEGNGIDPQADGVVTADQARR